MECDPSQGIARECAQPRRFRTSACAKHRHIGYVPVWRKAYSWHDDWLRSSPGQTEPLSVALRRSARRAFAEVRLTSRECHNVWSGRASQDDVGRLTNVRAASMYSASWWSLCSGPAWVSARIQDSLAERPRWAKMAPSLVVAPGRPFVHLLHPSRRPRRETAGYLTDVIVQSSGWMVHPNPFRKGSRASSPRTA